MFWNKEMHDMLIKKVWLIAINRELMHENHVINHA